MPITHLSSLVIESKDNENAIFRPPSLTQSEIDSLDPESLKGGEVMFNEDTDGLEFYNGTNCSSLSSGVGTLSMFAAETPPSGWMECDGTALSREEYANLFSVIGTSWGEGDGTTTFNIPDLRGTFVRGWNNSKSTGLFDPDSATRTAINTGGATGDAVGSVQTDEFKEHNHSYSQYDLENESTSDVIDDGSKYSEDTDSKTTGNTGGEETRPKNAYVMYIIQVA